MAESRIRTVFIRFIAAATLLAAPVSVWATPITGDLAYGGFASWVGNDLIFDPTLDVWADGDLAVISDISHATLSVPGSGGALVTPMALWTDSANALNYFTLNAGTRTDFGVGGSITLDGSGIMNLAGFDPTAYNWSLSFNPFSNMAFFSAASVASVPEPGTLLLLGAGLAGAALSRRRRKTTV